MDIADPKSFLRAVETAKTKTVQVELVVLRAAIREAVALELEELAEKHAAEMNSVGIRAYLLARARDARGLKKF